MRLTAIPRRPLVLLSPPAGGSTTVDDYCRPGPIRSQNRILSASEGRTGVKPPRRERWGPFPTALFRCQPPCGSSRNITPVDLDAQIGWPCGDGTARRSGRRRRSCPFSSDRTGPIDRTDTRATTATRTGPVRSRPEPDGAPRGTATAASGGARGEPRKRATPGATVHERAAPPESERAVRSAPRAPPSPPAPRHRSADGRRVGEEWSLPGRGRWSPER